MAASRVITVLQLRAACLDPAWRESWRAGGNPPLPPPRGRSEFPVEGTRFHQLAKQFTDWLTLDLPADPRPIAAAELWTALYDRFAMAELNALLAANAVLSAEHLSRALKAFCQRLEELRLRAGESFRDWRDLFLTHEYDLRQVPIETARGTLLVSGRPDAVRHVPGQGLEIVDYKLSRGSSVKEDLIQVAAYAHLLRVAKPGLRFAGVLEYYEPELHVTPAEEDALEGLWHNVILPAIEDLLAPVSPPAPSETSVDAGPKIAETYAAFGFKVRVLGNTVAPQLIRYRVEPAPGVRVVSLANRAEDLQVALHLKAPPLIQAAPGCVTIDLPKPQPDLVAWPAVMARLDFAGPTMRFPVGIGVEDEVVLADFSDPNMCHALVAGVAGSGKSEFLKSMVASLIAKNTPAQLRLFLIDPKAVTFTPLASSPHLAGPILSEPEAAIACLEHAVEEMESRYVRLAAEGHENITQRGPDADMPNWLVVFDEFADLVLRGRKEKAAFENLVARLAQKGRAAGIHVVLATQRPEAKVVAGLIKSNLPLKICLRVTNALNSQIVLDVPGAETLLGRGDLLCDRGRGPERAQSPYISAHELAALVGAEHAGVRQRS